MEIKKVLEDQISINEKLLKGLINKTTDRDFFFKDDNNIYISLLTQQLEYIKFLYELSLHNDNYGYVYDLEKNEIQTEN